MHKLQPNKKWRNISLTSLYNRPSQYLQSHPILDIVWGGEGEQQSDLKGFKLQF